MTPSSYSLKSIKKEFHDKGVYYTPPQLGEYIKSLIGDDIQEVYDPTCGRGNLLGIFPDHVRKFGCELDASAAIDARKELRCAEIVTGNTLYDNPFPEKTFELIVANPPFSTSYDPSLVDHRGILSEHDAPSMPPCLPPKSKADYLFILHILHKLSDTGVAYVLCFPGILYRGNREGKIRQWLVDHHYIKEVRMIPPKQFTDTSISTALLTLQKNRPTSYGIRMFDLENDLEREVSLDEIVKNDYNLSVSSYLTPPEPEKPQIDPAALHETIVRNDISHLRKCLNSLQFVCDLEGYDFPSVLDRMQAVIDEFRK